MLNFKIIFIILFSAYLKKHETHVIKPRIIGGGPIDSHLIPWQIHIYMYDKYGQKYTCGGSLISRNFILTAAHCIFGYEIFELIFGGDNTQKVIAVSKYDVLSHARYNNTTYEFDIGLIKLPQNINITDNIDIVSLPKYSEVKKKYAGMIAITSGWGRTSPEPKSESNILKVLIMEIIPNRKCPIRYMSKLCAIGEGVDTICKGDSGGALVIYEEERGPVQVGITSVVIQQCKNGWPALFTRVSLFLHWIHFYTRIPIAH